MRRAANWIAALVVAAMPASAAGQMVTMVPLDETAAPNLGLAASPAAPSADLELIETADASSANAVCGSVAKVASDLYKRYKSSLDDEKSCGVGYTSSGGMMGRGDCAYGGPKFQTQYHLMVQLFNALAPAWATIGPRRWEVYTGGHATSHSGTIQATGARLFVTPHPHFKNKVRVSVRKVDGLNPVSVAVCGTTRSGHVKKLWEFRMHTADPANKLYTRDLSNVHGLVLSVYLQGHNLLRKLKYRVRGTAL